MEKENVDHGMGEVNRKQKSGMSREMGEEKEKKKRTLTATNVHGLAVHRRKVSNVIKVNRVCALSAAHLFSVLSLCSRSV